MASDLSFVEYVVSKIETEHSVTLKKMFGENINRINTNSNNAFERPVVLLLIFSSSYNIRLKKK